MGAVRLIVVGGFLGAGKTTLLWVAAHRLLSRGIKVGLVTNDQAPDLVDTGLLVRLGLNVREVAGSCFCCDFPGLVGAAKKLRDDFEIDVLLAEPVGSCTDLSAAVFQPLKDLFQREFVVSPLSVLADPVRLRDVLTGRVDGEAMHPGAAYILRKQLEEADLVLVNKADLLDGGALSELEALVSRDYPGMPVRHISARAGDGIDAWLDTVLAADRGGLRIAAVDYDRYAEGEAALGWLNADVLLAAGEGVAPDWSSLCLFLMERLRRAFQARRAPVGHVKILLSTDSGHLAANLTRQDGPIDLRGTIAGAPPAGTLIVNARVEMAPGALERAVREALATLEGHGVTFQVRSLRTLRPARPEPTHRYGKVI